METAEIVKIAVSAAPYSIDKPYDYLVPPELLETAVPGVRVTVPFGRGNRTSEGIILARTPGEKMQGLKPLLSVLDRGPVLDGDGIALALWLRQRYFCTLFEAVKAILPAGLWYQSPAGRMAFTASNSVQKYRCRSHNARAMPSPSSTGPRSRTDSRGLSPCIFSPGVRARIMPSLVRLPRPKGTVTRTPGTAVSSSSGGTR